MACSRWEKIKPLKRGELAEDEQARKVKNEAIPPWAEDFYYNKELFSEVLLYYDDEALYFEVKGKEGDVVRFSFEMLERLATVIEEDQKEQKDSLK